MISLAILVISLSVSPPGDHSGPVPSGTPDILTTKDAGR
jgi:hypothetical protein